MELKYGWRLQSRWYRSTDADDGALDGDELYIEVKAGND